MTNETSAKTAPAYRRHVCDICGKKIGWGRPHSWWRVICEKYTDFEGTVFYGCSRTERAHTHCYQNYQDRLGDWEILEEMTRVQL